MRNSLILLLTFFSCNLFGQQILSVKICEHQTNKPLPYATIYNNTSNRGSISNMDGSCKILYFSNRDSLFISYVGYVTSRTIVSQITNKDTIFLVPDMVSLSGVTVVTTSNQEVLVNQLYDVLSFNRYKNDIFESKSNVLLTSFIDSIPLERIESVGNLYIKNGGVDEYIHRMGRFGQNIENNFFTLSMESILNNFKLFDDPKGKIPLLITQLNKNKINTLYNLSRNNLSEELTKINFDSKTSDQFSGFVIFNKRKDIVSIHLTVSDIINGLIEPIYKDHSIDMLTIEYDYKFNEQTNQPSYINLKYEFQYNFSDGEKRKINTNMLVLLSELNETYFSPILSTEKFNKLSDYQQIIITSFDSLFWENNYVYTHDLKDTLSLNYFKIHGYVTNYQIYKSNATIRPLIIGLVEWNKQNISFSDLNNDHKNAGIIEEKMNDVHNLYFISELYKLEIGYFLNPVQNSDNSIGFNVITFLNASNSYYFLPQNLYSEIAINLYFDTFEKNRKELESAMQKTCNVEDAINQLKMTFNKTKQEADNHLKKSEKGINLDWLLAWNEIIESAIYTDRISIILDDLTSNGSIVISPKMNLFNYSAEIGVAYLESKQYEKAKTHLIRTLNYIEDISQKRLGEIYYDLGLAYSGLDETEQACSSFVNAQFYGYKISSRLINKVCK